MDLTMKQKHLMRYLFDQCDICGVYTPNYRLMSLHIGEKCTRADIEKLPQKQIQFFGEKIIVTGFLDFQYGVLGHKSPIHIKVLNGLSGYGISYPILRVYNTPEEEDKDKEEEEEKEKRGATGKKKTFTPPTLEEFKAYFKAEGFKAEVAERAWKGYNEAQWHKSNGEPVRNWKQTCQQVWFKDENKIPATTNSQLPMLK